MNYLLGSLLALSLGACATTPPPTLVTKVQTHVIITPDTLLTPCQVTQPPSKSDFMTADMLGRQSLLADYTTNLLKDLGLCNAQLKEIKAFQDKQINLYSETKKDKP
jgi:hypothetical protein